VVYAIREQRKEGWLMRTAYAAFYRILQRVANIEIPLDAGDFCKRDAHAPRPRFVQPGMQIGIRQKK
jgi:hypothetical protein